jgi:Tol biopolymer transport system component
VLMDSTHHDFDAVWSPDGARLYFSCDRFNPLMDLCTTAPDGMGLRPIKYAAITALDPPCTSICIASTPQKWDVAPTGRSIAFETIGTSSDGSQTVWVGALDGSSATKLTTTTSFQAKWSPTSDRVLLSTWDGKNSYGLATVHPDGTAYQAISNFADNDQGANWSPNGATLVFQSLHTGSWQVWAMNSDGTGRRSLTATGSNYGPLFSPKSAPVGVLVGGSAIGASRQPAPARTLRADASESPSTPPNACHLVRAEVRARIVCSP